MGEREESMNTLKKEEKEGEREEKKVSSLLQNVVNWLVNVEKMLGLEKHIFPTISVKAGSDNNCQRM